jgi:hypothetical protein
MIGLWSGVPLPIPTQVRRSDSSAIDGAMRMAIARFARSDSGLTTHSPAALRRAGQPPPMSSVPDCACLKVSLPPA